MGRRHEHVFALNSGGVDPDALSRMDLEKARIAGEHPVSEFLPMVLGPLTLRPGFESLARITGDAQTRQIRFLRSAGNSYILLMSPGEMRISFQGAIQQVPAVSTSINSGSWTNASTSPATATGGATLTLNATSTQLARLRQTVSVALADRTVTNILRVVVSQGPVILRVGRTSGGTELINDAVLDTGTHKIGFVPGAGVASVFVEVQAENPVTRTVSQIQFESTLLGGTGDLVLPTPWTTFNNVRALRNWPSIDVMFIADGASQQRRILHRGPLSWGIELYKSDNGPFVPGTTRLTMTPAALTGNTTITASAAYFRSQHVGALIELTQTGKTVNSTFNAIDLTSDFITVVGVSSGRIFSRAGTSSSFIGTVVLERSFDEVPTTWTTFLSFTDGAVAFASTGVDDAQTNITVHYRWRVTAYTSGSCTMTLVYASGVQVGRARVTSFVSSTVVNVETLVNFGNTGATRNWRIGAWSDASGWPRVPVIHDSRLHWFEADQNYASVPDDYANFDDDTEGDSAPLTRSVGSGGEDGVLWALSESRLLVGTSGFEAVIAASELDEPLTPSAYTVRKISRRGSADVEAVEHDDGAFYVQRSGVKLYELSIPEGGSRYRSQDVSRLNPAAYRPGIVRLAVSQQPDTRCYAVLSDGTMAVLTYERDDKVVAITRIQHALGLIEDVCTLAATDQDDVYIVVNIGGARYHERMGKEVAQRSKATCTLLDSFKVLTGSISSITGATHLAGRTVQVWADGQRRADVTLNGSGVAALGATYSRVVYGRSYSATWRSLKLAYAGGIGTAIGNTKKVHGAGLILSESCLDGIRIGRDPTNTDPMPAIVNGAVRTANQFFSHYDENIFPINSDWDADARVYLSVNSAEGPCTIQSLVLDIETRDGSDGNGSGELG